MRREYIIGTDLPKLKGGSLGPLENTIDKNWGTNPEQSRKLLVRSVALKPQNTNPLLWRADESYSTLATQQSTVQQEQKSRYDRLGGLTPISVVVSDFINALVADAVLNANPAIDAARKGLPAPFLKYHVTALVCQATGGPCQYHGREMNESHAHMNITERDWDRMVTIFKEVLAKHRVPAKETQELLDIVGSTRADIVVSGSSD